MIMIVSISIGRSAVRMEIARHTELMITHRTKAMSAAIGKFERVRMDVPLTCAS